jgi:hypothetical protein
MGANANERHEPPIEADDEAKTGRLRKDATRTLKGAA